MGPASLPNSLPKAEMTRGGEKQQAKKGKKNGLAPQHKAGELSRTQMLGGGWTAPRKIGVPEKEILHEEVKAKGVLNKWIPGKTSVPRLPDLSGLLRNLCRPEEHGRNAQRS